MFVVFLLTACGSGGESVSKSDLEGQADSVNSCCKIEGSEIGADYHLVRLGSKTVLVHDWVAKADSPGEYVGFSITVSDGATVTYKVKAGTERYSDSATTWIHPNGAGGGSASPGISNVDFCGNCDNPDGCDGGGGGGGDSGCDNPDGCPDGSGGPGPVL